MNLDLQQLRSFFMVVQAGGFSNAARRLNRTQSAVSHAVRKLEDAAGVRLIERRGRGVRPTEEGRRLYRACESIFAELEIAQEDLERGRGRVKGRLRMGATVEFGNSVLMRHIEPFMAANPGIELDFRLSSDLLTPLLRDDIDLAIDCGRHDLPELERTVLFREAYMVACSPSYLESHAVHAPEDLAACTVITMDKECEWWNRFLTALPEARRPVFGRTVAVNHIRGMISAAVSDVGVLLAPSYSVESELGRGELVALFPEIRLLEDRFALYQKVTKAGLLKHRLLKRYLKSLKLSEFGV